MNFPELLKTWSTRDICEQLERLNDLPTPLAPEVEMQRQAIQNEWDRRPTDQREKARADIEAARASA